MSDDNDKAEEVYEALINPHPNVRILKRGDFYRVQKFVPVTTRFLGAFFPRTKEEWVTVVNDIYSDGSGTYFDPLQALACYKRVIREFEAAREREEEEARYLAEEWRMVSPDTLEEDYESHR